MSETKNQTTSARYQSWFRWILISFLLPTLLLYVLDKAFDRKALVQPFVEYFNVTSPYKISIGAIEHSFFKPSELTLHDIKFASRKEGVVLTRAYIKIDLTSLVWQSLHIEEVQFDDLHGNLSQAGLTNFIHSQPKNNTQPKVKQTSGYQLKSITLDSIRLSSSQFQFDTKQQSIKLENTSIQLAPITLMKNGVVALNTIQAKANAYIEKLAINQQALKQLVLVTQLQQGKLVITKFATKGFDGSINLQAQLDLKEKVVDVNNLTLKEVSLSQAVLDDLIGGQQSSVVDSHTQVTENQDSNKPLAIQRFVVNKFTITHSNIALNFASANNINAEIKQLVVVDNYQLTSLNQLNKEFEFVASSGKISTKKMVLNKVESTIKAIDNGIEFKQTKMNLGQGKLALQGSLQQQSPDKFQSNLTLNWQQLLFATFQALMPEKSEFQLDGVGSGEVTVTGDFTVSDILNQSDMNIQLINQGLKLDGIDIDALIDGLKASQTTSVKDVGSFLLGGPLAMIAMQVADLGTGAAKMSGSTEFPNITAKLTINRGKVMVHRALINSAKNKIAAQGQIDLNKSSFQNLAVGFLNNQGCADWQQTLSGPFNEVKDVLLGVTTGAVTSPITDIFSGLKNAAKGGCEAFFKPDE